MEHDQNYYQEKLFQLALIFAFVSGLQTSLIFGLMGFLKVVFGIWGCSVLILWVIILWKEKDSPDQEVTIISSGSIVLQEVIYFILFLIFFLQQLIFRQIFMIGLLLIVFQVVAGCYAFYLGLQIRLHRS